MGAPQLGYLALSENPTDEAGRALVRQFVLAREADRMGYDDIWLAEHHGESAWPQAGVLSLLGHLSAVTSKARIGSLPLLPALRDPALLAEELATLALLSKGRFQLGVASGAALPGLLQRHGLTAGQARQALWHFLRHWPAAWAEGPQAVQPAPAPVPVWLAAEDEASLRLAGEQGWGLVASATHTAERVQRMVRLYTQASGGQAPRLVLARFACSADTPEEAEAVARPYLQQRAERAIRQGWGATACDPAALRALALVGRHAEVAEQFKALADRYGATHVAIVPTSGQFDTHKHILAAFVDEVRPLLDE
ncbi:LLM class flavin-dependent oxidoreductase [Ideonella sp. B7]|uniref:LLM class flavin-dependent oxidoreductase n=1 Tax=Ideonella benzenivorans TaxID=2831643 RepID=UPI001CECA5F8|nr:LLM class flavin-dependent oxidoreductase [Ideonella benzenivorans]MCA6218620.1 LLM class flavin-dependent oxidoreductase [Ideonella benzenivorans]